jgi:hypothetical protein
VSIPVLETHLYVVHHNLKLRRALGF